MDKTLFVSAFTVCVALAQPVVSVQPIANSIPALTIMGPGDPSFLPSVQAMIGPSEFPALQPALPYSVLIRNDGAKPLIGICVYFAFTDANGKPGARLQNLNNVPPTDGKPILAPGASLFAAIESGYTLTAAHSRIHVENHPIEMYNSAKAITISVDSVLFADGRFAGPDTQNCFANYQATLAADRDFAQTVLRYRNGSIADLQTFLESTAASDRALDGGSGEYQFDYTRRTAVHARAFKQVLARNGAERVFALASSLYTSATSINLRK